MSDKNQRLDESESRARYDAALEAYETSGELPLDPILSDFVTDVAFCGKSDRT